MTPVRAVISDFGGVLTTPLLHSFAAFQDHSGVPMEALGRGLQTVAERDGANPLYELEKGRMTEADFLAKLGDALAEELGHARRDGGLLRGLLRAAADQPGDDRLPARR